MTATASLEQEYEDLLAQLPSRAPIYLPTDKIPLEDKIRGIRHVIQIYRQDLDAVYRPRLRALREQFKGRKRCFLIGNGPSLNETDLAVLKDEVTFAVNGFFLKAADLEWKPTFYVVEDHLVAEDRAPWINEFKGPIKLFPAYLGYMFEPGEDTIFYNHRPRKSYPHGFDFSLEADKITYTGCTVTFSMMQIAAYLGFEEIYLIGVDASYAIPEDAKQSKDYGVGVLDMKSDDPNHFDPDYFGKGFRWHDPQVDKMIEAYTEARRTLEGTGQMIYNAGIGGQLEVFERRPFHDLFPNARSAQEMLAISTHRYPRLLVLDMTAFGNGSATGEIKSNLFKGWPAENLLQIARHGREGVALSRPDGAGGWTLEPTGADSALDAALRFEPDVVMYRPVPDTPWLHALAMTLTQTLRKPVVSWIMDDWPEDLAERDPAQWSKLEPDLKFLLEISHTRLSICDAMSSAFEQRYGLPFKALANGIRKEDWPERPAHKGHRLLIRYAGGLATNMQRASVLRLARVVEQMGKSGHAVAFEINTQPWWRREAESDFSNFVFTALTDETRSPDAYRKWLREADIVVIAYNFDAATKRYIRYSMANKLPECLASGAVLLAHGPADAASIHYIQQHDLGMVVAEEDEELIEKALLFLLHNPERRQEISQAARDFVIDHHNLVSLHQKLRSIISEAATANHVEMSFPKIEIDQSDQQYSEPVILDDAAVQHNGTVSNSAPSLAPDMVLPHPPLKRPWYAPFGDRLRQTSPALFSILQRSRRPLWRLAGAWPVWIAGLATVLSALLLLAGTGPLSERILVSGAILASAALLAVVAVVWHLRAAIRTLSSQNSRLAADIAYIHELATGREGRVDSLAAGQNAFERKMERLRADHERDKEMLSAEIERSARAAQFAALADAQAEIKSQASRMDALLASQSQTWRETLQSMRAELEMKLNAQSSRTGASLGRATQAAQRRDALVSAQLAAYAQRMDEIAASDQSLRSRLEALQQQLNEVLKEQSMLLERAEAQAAGHDDMVRREMEAAVARLSASMEALDARQADRLAGSEQSVRSRLEPLQRQLGEMLEEQSRLLERAEALAAGHGELVRRDFEAAIAEFSAGMKALEMRQADQRAGSEQAVQSRLEELQQRLDAILSEQSRLLEKAEAQAAGHDDRVRRELEAAVTDLRAELQERVASVTEDVESGARNLLDAKEEIRQAIQALKQGLEQRMGAEMDEYARTLTSGLLERIEALEAAKADGESAFFAGLTDLQQALDTELRPQIGMVREVAESARKVLELQENEAAKLQERIEASERQIGALRYPDAPDVFVFFGHHKCASRFFRVEVFRRIATSTGARIRRYKIQSPPFHYSRMDELDLSNINFDGLGHEGRDVVYFANATERCLNKITRSTNDWLGLRVIRDPRQVLVSNYFHHKGDHPHTAEAGWVWDQLVHDKPLLRQLPEEDGILHELDNISKQVIEDQILAPFADDRIKTIRLEDFSSNARKSLNEISQFLKVPDVAGIDLKNTKANPDSSSWNKHFTSKIRGVFKERYGQALIDLGYAEDMDW